MQEENEKLFVIMCKYLENEEQRLRNNFRKTLIRYIIFALTAIIVVAIICFSPTTNNEKSENVSITSNKILEMRR